MPPAHSRSEERLTGRYFVHREGMFMGREDVHTDQAVWPAVREHHGERIGDEVQTCNFDGGSSQHSTWQGIVSLTPTRPCSAESLVLSPSRSCRMGIQ